MALLDIVTSCFLFSALYFEVFVLLTLFENLRHISITPLADTSPKKFPFLPSVTIIIPCFNEEKTVSRTVQSILDLDYPKEKLRISIVDDGSTDNTWQHIASWKGHPQIDLHQKKNGGKFTALNYGIEKARTDLVGCLDADSFVEKDALRKIVYMFQHDQSLSVVAPAIKIWKPDSLIRRIQSPEYIYGIFIKKIFSLLHAVHVTPGPFSIFKRTVFKEVGLFKHAHNTEDMEIAMRMHRFHKKIGNCHDAYVYTVGPKTFKSLHKQRVRWTYGFIKNALDYRDIFFNKKYGNVGFITLPFALSALIGVLFFFTSALFSITNRAIGQVQDLHAIGWRMTWPNIQFETFFLPTHLNSILSICIICFTIALLTFSFVITPEKIQARNLVAYILLYPFIAMTWIIKSLSNVILVKKPSWR